MQDSLIVPPLTAVNNVAQQKTEGQADQKLRRSSGIERQCLDLGVMVSLLKAATLRNVFSMLSVRLETGQSRGAR